MKKLAASQKNINRVVVTHHNNPKMIGPKFGLLVYRTNLPAPEVASHLGVTRATIYRWFFGDCEVSDPNRANIITLAKAISKALKSGDLPVYGTLTDRSNALEKILRGIDLGQKNA